MSYLIVIYILIVLGPAPSQLKVVKVVMVAAVELTKVGIFTIRFNCRCESCLNESFYLFQLLNSTRVWLGSLSLLL